MFVEEEQWWCKCRNGVENSMEFENSVGSFEAAVSEAGYWFFFFFKLLGLFFCSKTINFCEGQNNALFLWLLVDSTDNLLMVQ